MGKKVFANDQGGIDLVDESMKIAYKNLPSFKKSAKVNPNFVKIGAKDNMYLPSLPSYSNIGRRFEEREGDVLIDSIAGRNANLLLPTSHFNGIDTGVILPEAFEFTAGKFIEFEVNLSEIQSSYGVLFAESEAQTNFSYNSSTGRFNFYLLSLGLQSFNYAASNSIEKIKISREGGEFLFFSNDIEIGRFNCDIHFVFNVDNIAMRILNSVSQLFFNGNIHNINFNNELFIPLPHQGIGFKADNSVVNLTIEGELGEDYVEGGSNWMQENGAVKVDEFVNGVKTENVNLYTPSDVNRTFEFWINPNQDTSVTFLEFNSSDGRSRIVAFKSSAGSLYMYVRSQDNVSYVINNQPIDKSYHIVLSIIGGYVKVWVNGVTNGIDYDLDGSNVYLTAFLRQCKNYLVKEFNFKPTDAQVTEWYNEGRPDLYELPAAQKTDLGIKLNNASFALDTKNISANLIWGNTPLDNGYLANDNKKELYVIRLSIVSDIALSGVLKPSLGRIIGNSEVECVQAIDLQPNISQDVSCLLNVYDESDKSLPYCNIFVISASDMNANVNVSNVYVEKVGCLHEYKPQNIYNDFWLDTGATPEVLTFSGDVTKTEMGTSYLPNNKDKQPIRLHEELINGVIKENDNLYTPSDMNRTFEFWFKTDFNGSGTVYYFGLGKISDIANYRIIIYRSDAFPNGNLSIVNLAKGLSYNSGQLNNLNHFVVSYINDKLSVWLNGNIVVEDSDFVGNEFDTVYRYMRNATYYTIREHNFKPTDEQVTEWYNDGRPDLVELPEDYKVNFKYSSDFSTSTDGWNMSLDDGSYTFRQESGALKFTIDTKGTREDRPHINKRGIITDDLFSNGFVDVKITNAGTSSIYLKGIGFRGAAQLFTTPIEVQAGETTIKTIQVYKSNVQQAYVRDIYLYLNQLLMNEGEDYIISKIEVTQHNCLHEYKPASLTDDTWIDTGATPIDITHNGYVIKEKMSENWISPTELNNNETLIKGTKFFNASPAGVDFLHNNNAGDAEVAFFDRSNTAIWSDMAANSKYYDVITPHIWHTSEMNQENIFTYCLDKYKLWCKKLGEVFKDIFLYNTALTGINICKAKKYVNVGEVIEIPAEDHIMCDKDTLID